MRSRVPVFHSCRGRALSFRWVPRQRMPQAKHGCWVVSMKLSYPVLGTYFACNTRTVVPWSTLGKWCLGIFLETGIKEIMSRRLKPVMGHLPPHSKSYTSLSLPGSLAGSHEFLSSSGSRCLWHLQAPFLLESQQPMLAGHPLTELNLFICTWLFRIFIFPAPFFALVLWQR